MYEIGRDTSVVLRALLGWDSVQGHLPGAWDKPAHGKQLGAGDGTATKKGWPTPPALGAGQKAQNRLTFSIS